MIARTLRPDIADILAKNGIDINELADLAGVKRSTLHVILHPEAHPLGTWGGVHPRTIRRLITAVATKLAIDPEAAKQLLTVEADQAHK